MLAHSSLEEVARNLLDQEWARVSAQAHRSSGIAPVPSEQPVLDALPELVGLVEERHDQPVASLKPMIVQLLAERSFIDENGDSVIGDEAEYEEQAEITVRVLEEMRLAALSAGRWSDAAVPPICFG